MTGGKAHVQRSTLKAIWRLYWPLATKLTWAQAESWARNIVRQSYWEAENLTFRTVRGDDHAIDCCWNVNLKKLREDMARYHPKYEERGIPLFNRYVVWD